MKDREILQVHKLKDIALLDTIKDVEQYLIALCLQYHVPILHIQHFVISQKVINFLIELENDVNEYSKRNAFDRR